jgi:uncharacterized protein (DUF1330 family)
MLWAVPGREDLLVEYENAVLARLDQHRARLLTRVRALADVPHEVQIIEFPSEEALADFQNDPARLALSGIRDRAIERTQVIRVDPVQPPG